jgi:hypothetical protein
MWHARMWQFRMRAKQLLDTYGLRVAAALVAAAALGGALYRVPALERTAERYLDAPDYSLETADLDPLKFFVSIGALDQARNTIPKGDTYTIVVGDEPPLSDDPVEAKDSALAVSAIFRFWLIPLRYTPKLDEAEWVIAYHQPSDGLGIRYSKEIYLSWEANLVEVER